MSTPAHVIPVTAGPTVASDAAFLLCSGTLVTSVVLQKIAIPGTEGSVPINLVLLAIAFAPPYFDVLEINTTALLWYATFVATGAVSLVVSSSASASSLSLGLLLAVQLPLVFRLAPSPLTLVRLWGSYPPWAACAAVGLVQFAAQFALGSHAAFFLDTSLPDGVILKGYNNMIPLYYSSTTLKSNGFFFLEPSFFCQFLAVALVAELLIASRMLRLVLLGAGLVSSYSGTGLTMLALFLPVYFVRQGSIQLVAAAAFAGVVLVFFGEALHIDAVTARITEFSDDRSSGSARFLSMFTVLQDLLLAPDFTLFTGLGPGTVQQSFERLPYLAFDPTWGKLLYEYGLIGTFAYLGFFYASFCNGAPGLRFALGYTYFLLGGYLLNPSVLMQMASLVVWCGAQRAQSPGRLLSHVASGASTRTISLEVSAAVVASRCKHMEKRRTMGNTASPSSA